MFCDTTKLLNRLFFGQSIAFVRFSFEPYWDQKMERAMRFLLEEKIMKGGHPPSIHPSPWMSLFILSSPPWPAVAKWEWISGLGGWRAARTRSWAYQVSPNIEPISKVVHIRIIVCRVEWINKQLLILSVRALHQYIVLCLSEKVMSQCLNVIILVAPRTQQAFVHSRQSWQHSDFLQP